MTQQEIIEQNVRLTLGDLTLQLIVARARIAELEAGEAARDLDKQPGEEPKRNGKDHADAAHADAQSG